MKKIMITVGLALALMLGNGCDNRGHSGLDYRVNVVLDNKHHHDSATLLVLEEEYNRLRVCGTARVKNGKLTFTGQTDKPKAALIRWDNDTVEPFYFVLESGDKYHGQPAEQRLPALHQPAQRHHGRPYSHLAGIPQDVGRLVAQAR